MAEARSPQKIRVETRNFILRTVEAADVTPRWAAWLADPEKTRMLNARPITLSVADLHKYLANFDQVKAHCLGIFDRDTGQMLGFWEVYVDWTHREFLLNVMLGERPREGLRAREETQNALTFYFFGELGLEAMRCSVLSTNAPVLHVLTFNGAVHEHTSHKPSAAGGEPVALHHYRVTREAWAAARARRLAREAAAQPS
ncbi:MAG: GNAT family N-acetyltransferase [Micropepsaceae bacterium]